MQPCTKEGRLHAEKREGKRAAATGGRGVGAAAAARGGVGAALPVGLLPRTPGEGLGLVAHLATIASLEVAARTTPKPPTLRIPGTHVHTHTPHNTTYTI